ncbi:uncharacterized protein KY384_007548 [Bacidia gigantensis]|uniref:uncharacterized protein n=1 Tax=Bacidia gigantensis TaxID=2732470 RepID=UPI001D049482|nr:uncharacterized protein KY384_007548 [Bacidia gigantensis]KAG8527396.1 hypothetical protein KY384_007548 [Bacidia gigantensis]
MANPESELKKVMFVPLGVSYLLALQSPYLIDIENNPEVMTTLVHKLGLSKDLSWHDVFSLDDPELLAFVPRPAHALLLVFPVSKAYERFRAEEDKDLPAYTGFGPNEEVLWFKQTIGNACGLMGLLHAVSNGMTRDLIGSSTTKSPGQIRSLTRAIVPATPLSNLITEAIPRPPAERVKLIETSSDLATAHASAAATGSTEAPPAEASIDLHFVAFVKSSENNLWELDGSRKGPLNRGKLPEGEDVLGETAIDLGPRKFLKREAESADGELRFSILALGPGFG